MNIFKYFLGKDYIEVFNNIKHTEKVLEIRSVVDKALNERDDIVTDVRKCPDCRHCNVVQLSNFSGELEDVYYCDRPLGTRTTTIDVIKGEVHQKQNKLHCSCEYERNREITKQYGGIYGERVLPALIHCGKSGNFFKHKE